jgi:hypothetical protein
MLTTEDLELVRKMFSDACVDHPILVLHWNSQWVAQHGLPGQQAITQFILANGGSDPRDSNFIFHFQTYTSLIGCRDAMRVPHPEAFSLSSRVVNAMIVQYGLALEQPTAMATAWVIMKTAVMETDYRADEIFFCE